MKNNLFLILFAFAMTAQGSTVDGPAPPALTALAPAGREAPLAKLVAQILARYDYQSTKLDNAMSAKIFDHYLTALDPQKLYFLETDMASFANARNTLGQAIDQEDLGIPFDIFRVFQNRIAERYTFSSELLKSSFDFELDESYEDDRDKGPWAKSEVELHDLWRKLVKNDWLELRLAGEKDNRIRDLLSKRYSDMLARTYKFRSEDVFQLFMDAYATAVEPHTDYLGLKAVEEFDIEMKLSLVGVGAMFEQRGEYLTIRELAPGSPAAMSNKLNIGDRLVGVGQGPHGPIVNVIGWRFDDVGTLVRGAKGSTVRLIVLPGNAGPNGKTRHVTLVRNTVSFGEDEARKSVIQVSEGKIIRNVGVITLPAFYQDFDARSKGEQNFKSATRDVARLLTELKENKVDAVIIDLRGNGGGSLDEAVGLAGLFIGAGPVVQERDSEGEVHLSSADDTAAAWSGPLGVLINRRSASASEIFAAAIQDYGRGIVLGETSFGKGTVQTIVNLDQLAHNEKPEFGELKMTIAQFFRVNGSSTQLHGVTPDIDFPSALESVEFRESNFDNALPWTKIKPAEYAPQGNLTALLPMLQSRHAARIAKTPDFQSLLEEISKRKLQGDGHVISLNESIRRKERDMQKAKLDSFEGDALEQSKSADTAEKEKIAASKMPGQQESDLQVDERMFLDELAEEKKQKDAKDVLLIESAHILSDEVELLGGKSQ